MSNQQNQSADDKKEISEEKKSNDRNNQNDQKNSEKSTELNEDNKEGKKEDKKKEHKKDKNKKDKKDEKETEDQKDENQEQKELKNFYINLGLGVIAAVSIVFALIMWKLPAIKTKLAHARGIVTQEEAKEIAENFINDVLMGGNPTAAKIEVEILDGAQIEKPKDKEKDQKDDKDFKEENGDENGDGNDKDEEGKDKKDEKEDKTEMLKLKGLDVYTVKVNFQGNSSYSYLTKDGKFFLPQVMDIEEISKIVEEQKQTTQAAAVQEAIPQSDKPSVELFVISFCPFSIPVENSMKPVVDLLGDKADIKVHFIASVPEGKGIEDVKSLHGKMEGLEDARQLCIVKNYPAKYWSYVGEINEKCYPVYRDGEAVYEKCWKEVAQKNGMNIATLDACVNKEGVDLINAEDKLAEKYGAQSSPTLIINGVEYKGSRSPEAFKTAICGAFNNQPDACAKTLEASGGAATGGC